MNYLYINLPKLNERRIKFSVLEKGDSLEVRLNELTQSEVEEMLLGVEKLRLKTDLSFKETNDAYGSIQVFSFS